MELEKAIGQLIDPVRDLGEAVRAAQEAPPVIDASAVAVLRLRGAASRLKELADDLERLTVDTMTTKVADVEDLGQIEYKRGSTRKTWRHDELFPVVLAKARDERKLDEETGEFEDPMEVAFRVFRECFSIGGGKVKGLQPRGIDPDEFCHKEPGELKLQFPGGAQEKANEEWML